jgi:ATP-dependent RNA helicase DDX51/DBP6
VIFQKNVNHSSRSSDYNPLRVKGMQCSTVRRKIILTLQHVQGKTKAKQRYLKRKKEKRKHRKAAAPKTKVPPILRQSESNDHGAVDREDNSEEVSSDGERVYEEGEGGKKVSYRETAKERPAKRRKLEHVAEDVDMMEVSVWNTSPNEPDSAVLEPRKLPTPVALPRFPLPVLPNAPSQSVLALQGLDPALVDAEIVDPSTSLAISPDAKEDTTTGLSQRMRRRLGELGINELFAGTVSPVNLFRNEVLTMNV